MAHRTVSVLLVVLVVVIGMAGAAAAETCLRVEEADDMLTPTERQAAVLLVRRQFELAGHTMAGADCAAGTYTLSHIRLGRTIVVTLSGPLGSREGRAIGLDDLPAVYSQLVRALVTGQPMGRLAVLDRTNVSAAQDMPPRRVQSDGYWHARVGHASLLSHDTDHGASFGVGYRAVFDRLGLDMSFLNYQLGGARGLYDEGSHALTLIKLEGLYFFSPNANRSAYGGGGLSYGRSEIWKPADVGYPTTGRGSGLQGELTFGYEIARVTSARLFAQADVTLPFYDVVFETFSYPTPTVSGRFEPPTITVERQYVPSLTLSVGIGWQR
jgi:hypothetical protein